MATDILARASQVKALTDATLAGLTSHALTGWTVPPSTAGSGQSLAVASGGFLGAGRVHGARVYVPRAATVTALSIMVLTAPTGTGTTGANRAGLFTDAGVLLATCADQTAAWASTGPKTMNLDVTVNLAPGWYRTGVWYNGWTTPPAFARAAAHAGVNLGQTDPNLLEFWTSADTAVGATAPNPLTGPYAAMNAALYVGLFGT